MSTELSHQQAPPYNDAVSLVEGVTNPEIAHLSIPTKQEVVERLRATLQYAPANELDESAPRSSFQALTSDDGRYQIVRAYGDTPAGEYKEIFLETEPDAANMFDEALGIILQEDKLLEQVGRSEGYWWFNTASEDKVQSSTIESFQVKDGDKSIDILNCSGKVLSEDQKKSIAHVFGAVSAFTGGKIFDRTSGLILAGTDDFEHKAYGRSKKIKKTLGDFQSAARSARLNMDDIFGPDADKTYERYAQYFEGTDVDLLQVLIAHELGHAMDIANYHELALHDIDQAEGQEMTFNRIADYSTFQKLAGWIAVRKQDGNYPKKGINFHKQDAETECVPTIYGATKPNEDFAETFAIAALGGDISMLPERRRLLAETIQKAIGQSQIGARKVELQEVDIAKNLESKQITKFGVRLFRVMLRQFITQQ